MSLTNTEINKRMIRLRNLERLYAEQKIQNTKLRAENKYHFPLGEIDGKLALAITSQVRLVDTRRFIDKIGMLEQEKFEELKNAVRLLI